jgi:hypothetical protein
MRFRTVLCVVLASLLVHCGDSPTEPMVERNLPSFATTTTEDGLSISTDKDDYQPGDVVHFTGYGWQPGDVLDIVLTDDPQTHDPHTWTVNVGADGMFHDSTYVVDEGDLNVSFTLVATSRATGRSLTVNFTDSNPGVPTLSAQIPNPAIAGLTATYTVTVPFGGNNQPCTVALSADPVTPPNWPSPPAGGFFSFSPATVRGTGGTQTSTLTVTLPAGMAANTYRFSVTSTHAPTTGDTCNGNAVSTTNPIDLVVVVANQPANTPATLAQFRSDATTTIATGGFTNETSVVLKASVSDPDAGNTVKLQVEVKPVATAFTNVASAESGLLASGSTASTTVTGLTNGTSYHWQARAVDNNGTASAWVSFGGNAETAADFSVDTDAPGVTINQAGPQADPTNTSPINFTVAFSKPVTGFVGGDVTLTGTAGATTATVSPIGPGGLNYNVAVSGMTTDGTVIASIAAGVAIDAAGNANVASTSTDNEVTYDKTKPTVTINQAASQADPTNASPINFTVEFSEPVTDFTAGDVSISGTASTSAPTVTPTGSTTYNVAVPVTTDGTVIADIAAGVANDLAGNPNVASTFTDHSVTYDHTAPTVTINQKTGQADPTGALPINFTVVFSENVTDFATGDVTLTGTAGLGTATATVTGSGTTYNVAVNGVTSGGTVIASIGADKATDAAGNGNTASTSTDHTVTYDPEPPAVSNVAVSPNPTNGTIAVTATARVDDAATGNSIIVSAEYSIDGGTPVAMNASDGSFNSATENVTALIPVSVLSTLSSGDHQVCVRGSDAAGNRSSFSDAGACATLTIDPEPPVVSNVAVNPNPTNGTINVTATAKVDDANTGNSKIVSAEYRIDNGSVFTMTASDGSFSSATENVTASIPAGTVAALSNGPHQVCVRGTDQAGNTSSFDDVGACATLNVDKQPPVVSHVTVSPSLTNGSIDVTATANVDDATTGNSKIVAAYYSIDGGAAVAMTASDGGFDEATETVTASIPAATVHALDEGEHTVCVRGKDLAGNTSSFSDTGACATLTIDKTPPEVTINQAGTQGDPTKASPINFTVVFSENVSDFATGDVTLSGTAGPTTAVVTGSGTTYNVAVNGMTGDGTVIASIASGKAHDAAGNGNNASTSTDNSVVYDKTPPDVACGTADGNWHAADVSIACTASDATSGLANAADASFSLTTNVAANTETSNAFTNSRDIFDNAGNMSTASPIGGNKVDKKAPQLTLTCPANLVILNDPAAVANWTATDGGSGVTPSGTVALVTSSIGSKTANVTVQDNVGNSSSASCNYTVGYNFAGFFAPVDRPNTMNVSKAGQAIPLKWRLTDALGHPITNLTSVSIQAMDLNCALGNTTDQIEEYASGSSGLQNLGDGNYQFNWKTPGGYAGSCKSVALAFGAGGGYTEKPGAFFTFKK